MGKSGWVVKRTLDGLEYFYNESSGEVDWEKPDELKSKSELEMNEGEWVWVPHPTKLWQPARKVGTERDGSVRCVTDEGKTVLIPKDGMMCDKLTDGRKQQVPLWPLTPSSLKLIEDDLVMAENVNAGIISYTLRTRYEQNELYTWVGAGRSVLVSVNPYKRLNIYGKDQIMFHFKKPPNKPLPPHPFGIACDSFESMLIDHTNQSILISGESGAGKTEATKQCLSFLAEVAGSDNNVEKKILMANPLLEAYGNAKTIRNNNSSRFGKWIEVYFDPVTRSICGAQIVNYLLEKSRVVFQQAGERNYHIFYQMCQDSQLSSQYELTSGAESFNYMNQSGVIKTHDVDDAADLAEVHNAMDELGFSSDEKEWAFRTAAAVLHLGNVSFKEKAEKGSVTGSSIKDKRSVKIAADFLCVKEAELEKVLCYRSIAVRSERNVIPLDPSAARHGLNALAKAVYGRMFDFLVKRVNDALTGRTGRFIGILDIFGFEIFENNSFEQLCINYCNEKLQQQFNRTTFKEEGALYTSEGIKFKAIEFIDNQPVLDLIEKKPVGILLMLDEECILPEGSDAKFMNKIESQHGRNSCFMTDKHRKMQNQLSFEIEHYAGIVKYDSSQFMDKNRDTLFHDMYQLCASSSDDLTAQMFPDMSRRPHKSLSTQFRGQLNDLMSALYDTDSRYIRCVKPNNKQVPDKFETPLVVEQLRYSGVFEAVQIRKQGYPFRLNHRQFAYRYRCINQGHKYKGRQDVDICREILSTAHQNFSEVEIGKTRVLYRAREHKILKLLRNLALESIVPICQKVIRGGIHREFSRRLEKATAKLDNALKVGSDIKLMEEAIKAAPQIIGPLSKIFKFQPRNLKKAKAAYEDLKLWVDLESTFDRLTAVKNPSQRQLDELEAAVSKASDLLHIPRTDRQKKLYELAKRQIIFMQISLKNEHIDQHGSKYDSLSKFKGLKDPVAFAKKKALPFGRKQLELGMHVWSKSKIPTALTQIQDKQLDKIAVQAFVALQGYMQDKKNPQPEEQGARFVSFAVTHSELVDELYAQIIKQTTQNPNPESAERGWGLLSVMVAVVVPSDDFENFLLQHFRGSPNNQQFLSILHETIYGEKTTNPPSAGTLPGMIAAFSSRKDRSRYSTHPGHA